MGLLSFFSKKPDDFETRGDSLLARNAFGPAKIEYEKALELLDKKPSNDTAMKPRLIEKLTKTRESLARQHTASAEHYAQADLGTDALTYYSLALELTEDPDLKRTILSAIKRIQAKAGYKPSMDEDTEVLDEDSTAEPEHLSDTDEFFAICGTYPDEIADAYMTYGDDFKAGLLALSRGDDTGAVNGLGRALDQCTDTENYIGLELSRALMNTRQFDQAESLLKQFLSWNPSSFIGISRLCDVYGLTDRFDLAHALMDTLPPDILKSRDCQLLKGSLYQNEKNFAQAESVFKRFLTEVEWDNAMARSLAATLEAMGRLDEARGTIISLLNTCTGCGQRPRPEDQLFFADISIKTGNYSRDLMDIYHSVAMGHPEYAPHCLNQSARILKETGDTAGALRLEAMAEAAAEDKRQD